MSARRPQRLRAPRRRGVVGLPTHRVRAAQRRLRARGQRCLHRPDRRGEPAVGGARAEPRYEPRLRALPELEQRGAQRAGTLSGRTAQMVAIGRALLNDNACCSSTSRRRSRTRARRRRRTRARAPGRVDDCLTGRANLGVVSPARARCGRARPGTASVHVGSAQDLLAQPDLVKRLLRRRKSRVSTFVLLTITGFGLGAMYFLTRRASR